LLVPACSEWPLCKGYFADRIAVFLQGFELSHGKVFFCLASTALPVQLYEGVPRDASKKCIRNFIMNPSHAGKIAL
jgi:hypothetical protein